jgi:hypothetical protein
LSVVGTGGRCGRDVLVRKGITPLIIERETFPRFHIGESMDR